MEKCRMEYPILNTIHDNRMSDRLQPLLNEMDVQGITCKLWNPIECVNSVVKSINLSHKQIVQDAKFQGLKRVFIGEDDLMFTCKGAWDYFLESMPETFDLYLACTFIVPISNNKVCGFHLYAIDEKFYDSFLSAPEDVHIDAYMDELKGDYKFCYPFPALQRPTWSSNNKAFADYNSALRPEDIWQGVSS